MKIGRTQSWNYDAGRWKERKITPDLWEISYAVTKRRAGRAPEGSGVPVDTEYHWYILAHQNVRKLDANDYTTSLAGLKFKIAHKRADTQKWSATPKTQRKRVVKFLRGVIAELEAQGEPLAEAADLSAPRDKVKDKVGAKAGGKRGAPKAGRKGMRTGRSQDGAEGREVGAVQGSCRWAWGACGEARVGDAAAAPRAPGRAGQTAPDGPPIIVEADLALVSEAYRPRADEP